jgi:ferric-dicitrate binding protein FerR (iron transport regulator)
LKNKKTAIAADKNEALKSLLHEVGKHDHHVSPVRHIAVLFARIAAVLFFSVGLAWVWYTIYKQQIIHSQQLAFSEIIVPVGEKSQIILSDGTHVWINSGSRLKYPLCFGKDSRDVVLEGEAYFDVTKGKKTFTVNTPDARIKVLGTAFNVKAYPEDMKTQTTVVRGLVRVESRAKGIKPVVIGPDQMVVIKDKPKAAINKKDIESLSVLNKVNTSSVTSWKDQLLVFSDETFEDIAIKMERWFNMKIEIDDAKLKKDRYTGKFVNNETIYQVLEAIKVTTPISYTVANDEIIITKR